MTHSLKTLDEVQEDYVQHHKLWSMVDAVVEQLMTRQPETAAPLVADALREWQRRPVAAMPPTAEQLESGKKYFDDHWIPSMLDAWVGSLLADRPDDPVGYSIAHFDALAGRDVPIPASTTTTAQASVTTSVAQTPRLKSQQFTPNPNPVILVLFYSAYGHVRTLANEACNGAKTFSGATVLLRRIPETLPDDVVAKMSITIDESIPEILPAELKGADGIIWAFPTRFGNPPAQVCSFMDATGQLWAQGSLVGKPAAVITASATQHGGQEMTPLHFCRSLLHHGMVFFGPSPKELQGLGVASVQGCSPYGASTVAGPLGERSPTSEEKSIAYNLGRRMSTMASKLSGQRKGL